MILVRQVQRTSIVIFRKHWFLCQSWAILTLKDWLDPIKLRLLGIDLFEWRELFVDLAFCFSNIIMRNYRLAQYLITGSATRHRICISILFSVGWPIILMVGSFLIRTHSTSSQIVWIWFKVMLPSQPIPHFKQVGVMQNSLIELTNFTWDTLVSAGIGKLIWIGPRIRSIIENGLPIPMWRCKSTVIIRILVVVSRSWRRNWGWEERGRVRVVVVLLVFSIHDISL